jgi:hypothetical protein
MARNEKETNINHPGSSRNTAILAPPTVEGEALGLERCSSLVVLFIAEKTGLLCVSLGWFQDEGCYRRGIADGSRTHA